MITITEAKPDLGDDQIADIESRYVRLGLMTPPSLRRSQILSTLRSLQLPIYNHDEVFAYLNAQFGVRRWGWRGLRQRDDFRPPMFLVEEWEWHPLAWLTQRHRALHLKGPYDLAVPIHVLQLVESLTERSNEIRFLISDVVRESDKRRMGDPFLAIYWPSVNELFVVAQWNEPRFIEWGSEPETGIGKGNLN